MFFDLLPPTSLATLQQALPQVVVNTWYTMADWLRREWSTWAPYNRLLYQAEVSDPVPVLDLQQWLHALKPVDFTNVSCHESQEGASNVECSWSGLVRCSPRARPLVSSGSLQRCCCAVLQIMALPVGFQAPPQADAFCFAPQTTWCHW